MSNWEYATVQASWVRPGENEDLQGDVGWVISTRTSHDGRQSYVVSYEEPWLHELLNDLGGEGWELVDRSAMASDGYSVDMWTLIFKRPTR